MKQPSAKARKIIESLQALLIDVKSGALKDKLTEQEIETTVSLLRSLDTSDEVAKKIPDHQFAIIPFILPFTLAAQNAIADTAASVIERQLQLISANHLLQLQDRLRGGTWNLTAHLRQWNEMKFDKLSRFLDNYPRLVAMASFHHNGFVREAAVKYLDSQSSGAEIPFLLIRLTDWVPPVTEQARQALKNRLERNDLRHFVDHLLLIEFLSKKKRGSDLEIIDDIHSALKAPENRQLLLKGLTASTWETRRMCLKILSLIRAEALAEKIPFNSRQVIEAVLAEKDVANRLLIFDFAADLDVNEQIELMLRLGKDTAPSIRRNALEILCQIDSASNDKNLERGLLDRSPLVREFARFKLIQAGDTVDVRQFYLDKLENKPSAKIIASSLAGLGEVGDDEDVEVLLRYFNHPQVSVRRFATLALGKLAPEGHDEVFLDMLDQSSIGLSRAATTVISNLPDPVDGPSLYKIFEQTKWKHVKLHALRLFNSLPKWDRIAYLLNATTSDQSEVKRAAITYVESWEQRYRTTFQFSLPGKEQQKRFTEAYANGHKDLSQQVRKTMDACLALCSTAE